MKAKCNFIPRLVVLLIMTVCAVGAMAQKYISGVYICADEDPVPDGYEKLDKDLNDGNGGKYLYLCIQKTDNPEEAITGLIIVAYKYNTSHLLPAAINADGKEYHPAGNSFSTNHGDMNHASNSEMNVYLYYTKDKVFTSDTSCEVQLISSLEFSFLSRYSSCPVSEGWVPLYDGEKDVLTDSPGDCNLGSKTLIPPTIFIKANKVSQKLHPDFVKLEHKEPTCTEPGYKEHNVCTRCGEDEFPGTSKINPLGHNWCVTSCDDEENGVYTMTCRRDASHKETKISKLLCVRAEDDLVSVGVYYDAGRWDDYKNFSDMTGIHYILDGEEWSGLFVIGSSRTIAKGEVLWLFGKNPDGLSISEDSYVRLKINGRVSITGSVMSLIDGTGESTEIPNDYCFYKLFSACGDNLIKAPSVLPATALKANCYANMFEGCINLVKAPSLPATTLTERCYAGMFKDCTKLTKAPRVLPATTLTDRCYANMFQGCTSLTEAPNLPATTLADRCYNYMFDGCTSLRSVNLGATEDNANYSFTYWLHNTAANGMVHITDQMAVNLDAGNAKNAASNLPASWRFNKHVAHASEDPEAQGVFYGTFYDSKDEYSVKAGTSVYTAAVDADSKEMKMTAVDGNIIPKGETVLTKGDTPNIILTLSDNGAAKSGDNQLMGSGTDTVTASADNYVFTRGRYGIGFYPCFEGEAIKPYTAFIENATVSGTKMVPLDFGQSGTMVGSIVMNTEAGQVHKSYKIDPTIKTKISFVDNDELTIAEEPGTIGNLHGREAMVVDLGGEVGKVAVAMKNVGVTAEGYIDIHRQDSDPYRGTIFTFEEANNYWINTLNYGWHVPTGEELELLTDKLAIDSRYICLKWDVSSNNTLWLPGYVSQDGNRGALYAGVKLEENSYAGMEFMFPEYGQAYKYAYGEGPDGYSAGNEYECLLRPFRHLRANNKCLKIETDNGVVGTYDISSDLKLSFTPSASTASMKLVFNDNAPIETEHGMEGTNLCFSDDGTSLTMTVNGKQVTYALDDVNEIIFFDEAPSVQLAANQDPDHAGRYYTTFYSGLEAYTLPEGVKAYTATMDEENGETVVRLAAIEGDVLPQGEAVLLYTTNGSDITMMASNNAGTKADVNLFDGVDVATAQSGINYMLSYGQKGLGFYKMSDSMLLSANKAFLPMPTPNMAKGLRMVFDNTGGGVTGIAPLQSPLKGDDAIYNIGGIRLNKLQKGINIVGGKKIVVK